MSAPTSNILTVYFAGKVQKRGYRQKIFHDRVMSDGYRIYSINGGKILYGGPFALSCDHGCFHRRNGHGPLESVCGWGIADDLPEVDHGGTRGLGSEEATARCAQQIRDCDAVHAYIDSLSCYGTLTELGYASAIGKPIFINIPKTEGMNRESHNLWFALSLPNIISIDREDETFIHPNLLSPEKSYKERYHEYLLSDKWQHKRQAKILEAGGRCQLCNAKTRLNVHHRTYERVFDELPVDLIALCEECHKKFHDIDPIPKTGLKG